MGLLNEELYMLKLSSLSNEELVSELLVLKRNISQSVNKGDTVMLNVWRERLECLNKYVKMLELMEPDID